MKLTQRQESLITRYLRDVAIQLDQDLPETEREQGLGQVQKRIDRELRSLDKPAVEDADVEAVLERLGTPARQASILSPRRDPRRVLMLGRDNVIWLGVCSGVAARTDLDPWIVRAFAVVLGLPVFTAPVVVTVYIALYLYMRRNSGRLAPLDTLRIVGRGAGTFLIALALHAGCGYLLRLVDFLYGYYLKRELPNVGEWGWLQANRDEYFFYAFMVSVPLAVLSALPLAGGWDYTLKRLSQAVLAVYGIVLSFGLASFAVGIILEFVQQFSD
ncbi:MAG: PspC domain-containing protein [Candidatus Hydrogenedentes bacterium]|nr:PspC domain-containing protein [Candidatus Hydrogenedentota bacterium]